MQAARIFQRVSRLRAPPMRLYLPPAQHHTSQHGRGHGHHLKATELDRFRWLTIFESLLFFCSEDRERAIASRATERNKAEDMARAARAAIADSGLLLSDRYRDEEDNTLTGEENGADFGVSQRGTTPPTAPMDRAWAIAFWVNVCITVLSAIFFKAEGAKAVNAHHRRLSGDSAAGSLLAPLLMVVVMIAVGWGVACMALYSLASCPKRMLQAPYVGFAGVWGVAAAAALWNGHTVIAVVCALVCAIVAWVFWKNQSRLRFGAANLKVAALAVRSMPGTIRLALFMSAVQVVWSMLSASAAGGSFAAFSPVVVGADGTTYSSLECQDIAVSSSPYGGGETTAGSGLSCHCGGEVIYSDSGCEFSGGFPRWVLAAFWLGSVTWVIAVLRNVVTATVAGSVASWWFSPGDTRSVRGAFYRATHSSFGSLCKAAAIVAVIRVAMFPLRLVSHVLCHRCFLRRFRDAVGYASAYAICFIGIYGLDFSKALRRVHELFQRRGITMIANDGIVSAGLFLLTMGLMSTYLVVVCSSMVMLTGAPFSGSLVALIMFVVVVFVFVPVAVCVSTTMSVLRSGHKAVFVCFVQDPEALANNHGSQTYDDLSGAWQQIQTECPGVASSNIPHVPIATSPNMVEMHDHRATTHTEYQV
ncbi:unnamed protein product [Ectocarpus sp. 6 AP-2014]